MGLCRLRGCLVDPDKKTAIAYSSQGYMFDVAIWIACGIVLVIVIGLLYQQMSREILGG